MRVENAGLGTTWSNFPGFSAEFIHMKLCNFHPDHQGNCRKCMKSQSSPRRRIRKDVSWTSLPLFRVATLHGGWGAWTRRSTGGCSSWLYLPGTALFLLIHRGITQGQGHASDSAFLGKHFCYGNYVPWHTFNELFAIIYCIIIKYVN